MRLIRSCFVVALLLCLASSVALAQQRAKDEWEALYFQSMKFLNAGDYRRGLPVGKKALEVAKRLYGPGHPRVSTSLNILATFYQGQGQYKQAEPLLKRSVAISEKALGRNHPIVSIALNNLASLYTDQSRYAEAWPLMIRALKIREKAYGPTHRSVATMLSNLAAHYSNQGQHGRAEPLLKRALAIWEKSVGANHPNTATSVNNLGRVCEDQGRHKEAESLYKRALAIREKAFGPIHPDVAGSLICLATLYRDQGRYAQAEPLYERALAIREKVLGRDHPKAATILSNYARLYHRMGQYGKAERLYKRSVATMEKALGASHYKVATPLNNLALLYLDLGKFSEAEEFFKRSLAIVRKALGTNHAEVATNLHNLAGLYQKMGQCAKAAELSKRALAISRRALGSAHPVVAIRLNNLAGIQEELGRHSQAKELYKLAITIWERTLGPDHPNLATGLSNLAHAHVAEGNWRAALPVRDRARKIARRHLARSLSVLSEREQNSFLARQASPLREALSFCMAVPGEPAVARATAEWLLNAKAVAGEAMTERVRLARESRDVEVAKTVERLQLVRAALASLTMSGPRGDDRAAHVKRIKKLAADEMALSKKLGQQTGSARRDDPWVGLTELGKAIPAGTVYVDVARFRVFEFKAVAKRWQPPHYVAWVIDGDKVSVVDLGEAEPIEKAVAAFRETMTAHMAQFGKVRGVELEKELRAKAEAVAALVWNPLRKAVGDARKLIISPDGALWLVPWGALPDGKGKYLVESRSISYVVSGRDLVRGEHKIKSRGGVLFADPDYDLGAAEALAEARRVLAGGQVALADVGRVSMRAGDLQSIRWARLPGTASEARAITPAVKKIVGEAPSVYMRKQALEQVFKAVRSPRILVVSSHGFFMEDQDYANAPLSSGTERGFHIGRIKLPTPKTKPTVKKKPPMPIENPLLRCGLVMAGVNSRKTPGSGDDGVLTGLEIVGTDLRGTELVVLSACQSGLGTVRTGEGVAGLRQAFQLAGARTVVSTLWQIPDKETAELMTTFFGNMAKGQSKSDALRNAQLAMIARMRKKGNSAHPFFWAAFTLTGDAGKAR
jgi:CHAT domain-containing protein/tetratricopeptide (TPR) repeat protein